MKTRKLKFNKIWRNKKTYLAPEQIMMKKT